MIGDACLTFLDTYGSGDEEEISLALFLRILRSRFLDWARKEKRREKISSGEEGGPGILCSPGDGHGFVHPEDFGDLLDAANRILEALEAGGKAEKAIIMSRVRGDTPEETCRDLGISKSAYRTRLCRARKRLLKNTPEN